MEHHPEAVEDGLTTAAETRGSGGDPIRMGSMKTQDAQAASCDEKIIETSSPATMAVIADDGRTAEKWNSSVKNVLRVVAACYGFIIMGCNDAVIGALIPYLEKYYGIDYTIVSLLFVSPFVAYSLTALSINKIHTKLGQRGVAIISPLCRIIAYTITCQHPPFAVLVVFFPFAAFGNGLQDAAWNAWIGPMLNSNEVLGFLHGAYGLGGTLSPLIATSMITRGLPWYSFYYILLGAAVVELAFAGWCFWENDGKRFRDEHPNTGTAKGSALKEAMSSRITWICAVFFFIYVGIEVSIGGWVVVFMNKIRGASPFDAGISETGYWLGITVGRVILGFVTPWIGEKLAILIYMGAAIGLHLIFYLVPSLPVSFTAVALEGFFLGPLFPAAVVAATHVLPPHLHVSGVGFAVAFGAAGACAFPFAVGAIAQAKGVQVLMPIVLAMLALDLAVWSLLPGLRKARRRQRLDGAVEKESRGTVVEEEPEPALA